MKKITAWIPVIGDGSSPMNAIRPNLFEIPYLDCTVIEQDGNKMLCRITMDFESIENLRNQEGVKIVEEM